MTDAKLRNEDDSASDPSQERRYLPGDPTPEQRLEEILRVDHAGEYGAQQIYRGQLAVLGHTKAAPLLQHMADQEDEHLKAFQGLLNERQVRPSALLPLWHVGGVALGAVTALMGQRAAMACTVAVEEVINDHYAEQAEHLKDKEPELYETVEKFRQEELEHRDIALEHEAELAPGYPVLREAVKGISRLAIKIAEKV